MTEESVFAQSHSRVDYVRTVSEGPFTPPFPTSTITQSRNMQSYEGELNFDREQEVRCYTLSALKN